MHFGNLLGKWSKKASRSNLGAKPWHSRLSLEQLDERLAFDVGLNKAPDLIPPGGNGTTPIIQGTAGVQVSYNLSANGWQVIDLDTQGQPSGQTIRYLLDPDETPAGAAINPATGNFTFTPTALGQYKFVVIAIDNGSRPLADAEDLVVNVTNQAPTFQIPNPAQQVNEDSGAKSIPNFATSISAGAPGESGQVLTFAITDNDNAALFSVGPAISSNGTLTYTPATNAFGTATIKVVLKDNGGIANGGQDTSIEHQFTIEVLSVNDAPSFTVGANQNVTEDSGAHEVLNWATNISAGPTNESGQNVSFEVTGNTLPGLFSAGPTVSSTGTLSYTLVPNAFGTATITLVLHDNGGTANGGVDTSTSQQFTIAVSAVNDAPVVDLNGDDEGIDFGADFTEDDGPVAIVSPNLTVTDVDNTTLVSATVTLTNAADGAAEVLDVDVSGTSITKAYDSETHSLTLTTVTPQPLVDFQSVLRTLTYNNTSQSPVTTTRIVEVVVNDGDLDSAVATSSINVIGVNDSPNLENPGTQHTLVEQEFELQVTATDPDAGDELTFILDEDNSPAGATLEQIDNHSAVIHWTPTGNQVGEFQFRVIVTDNGNPALADVETFTVVVGNEPPVVDLNGDDEGFDFETNFTEGDGPVALASALATVADVNHANLVSATITLDSTPNGAAETLDVDVSGTQISKGYANGVLTLSTVTPQPIADFQAVLRTLTYDNSSQNPSTADRQITVVVNDGLDDSNAATATVHVIAVNNSPSIPEIPPQTAQVGVEFVLEVTVTDPEDDELTLALDPDNSPPGATFEQNGNTLTIRWTPAAEDVPGPVTFRILATDNGSPAMADTRDFEVTVLPADVPEGEGESLDGGLLDGLLSPEGWPGQADDFFASNS